MNNEIDYAEMLEIPVETVTVTKRERKKPRHQAEGDLSEQLVAEVNGRMEEAETESEAPAAEEPDPNFAESKQIERTQKPKRKRSWAKGFLIGEVAAVCALCAVIFLTNIFMTDSAINTFVRGLVQGNTRATDSREYSDFKLTPVVSDSADAALTVSDTGVLSFEAKCSVYAPASGTLAKVTGTQETGYTVEIKHSDSFSTVISGLDVVYLSEGAAVMNTIPLGYTDGEGAVNVMMYSGDTLLNCYSAENNKLAWI